jgi:D-apiose dehydrogenase
MSKRTRLGVIGCGFFAGNHLNSWRDLADQGVELAAVCDTDAAKAKAAAEQFGVPHWYDDAATMLREEQVDLVDIITQVRSHKALTEMALSAGVAAIVQKPFGNDLDECRAMVAAAEKSGLFLAVHENFRFQKPNRIAAEVLASGAIGEPNWARISFRTGYDIYSGQPYLMNEERFVVSDLGAHVLDMARVFLGEVTHLSAEFQRRNPKVRGEDTATMMLCHREGGVSVVECTYESRRLPDVFPETMVEIEGSTGAIRIGPGCAVDITSAGKLTHIDGDPPVLPWAKRPWHVVQESVLRTCEHIHQRYLEGKPADVSGVNNLKTFALCDAAYEAAAAKRAVEPQV